METEVLVAVLSLVGTLVGTLGGILISNRLSNYRIQQLEKKVDKHNTVIDRVYKLEQNIAVIKEELENNETRFERLERSKV